MDMKLSIVIPIYNAEKYIEDCLASILPEMDDEIELLLIDDGSTDSSYNVIQRYEKSNIRILHHENQGVSYTRNRGIAEAAGTYIMFVDADDRLSPGWSKVVLKECACKADVIYYSERLTSSCEKIKKIDIVHGIFGIVDGRNLGNMSSPCSKLYRWFFLLQHQIAFHTELINGEDGMFNLCVILKSEKYMLCESSFYQYRIYTGSSSRRYSKAFFDSNLMYFHLAEDILKDGKSVESEINRCLSYAVTYSVYLYLSLVSTILEKKQKEEALLELKDIRLQEYITKYGGSSDCSKMVQLIYWLVQHDLASLADKLMILKNAVRKQQKREMKWVTI